MSDQPSAKEVIEKYQKRRQRAPGAFVVGIFAILFIFLGAIVLFQWFTNPEAEVFAFLRDTPTPTASPTSTATPLPPSATPTDTPTPLPPSETPTITPTPTIAGAFIYTVAEGDSLFILAERFGVDVNRLIEANNLGEGCAIIQGTQLLIPDPNETPPTATPIPAGLPRGYEIEYLVKFGDVLSLIAQQFNSTEDAILEANEDLANANEIFPCQVLIIPINLVTPIPAAATETPIPNVTPGAISTLTPSPTATP